jgi:hypothetical protein
MTLEQRIAKLETMITEIHAILTGKESRGVHIREYRAAINELARGNGKPLELYMKRGGKIPHF